MCAVPSLAVVTLRDDIYTDGRVSFQVPCVQCPLHKSYPLSCDSEFLCSGPLMTRAMLPYR